jgi:hypothetical protein
MTFGQPTFHRGFGLGIRDMTPPAERTPQVGTGDTPKSSADGSMKPGQHIFLKPNTTGHHTRNTWNSVPNRARRFEICARAT